MSGTLARWRADPVAFVQETYEVGPGGRPIVLDPAQRRILEAVRDHDRVAVRTGRGIGKTACAAGMVIPWFMATHYPARVVTSAGTWNHLVEKLWPEIRMWSRGWLLRENWEYQDRGFYSIADPDGWRVVADTSNTAENVEGHHAPNLMVVIDEAKAMPDDVFAALLASLTSDGSGVQKIVALSTPPLTPGGWFTRVSTSSSWTLVHVSGLDSDRVSKAYVEEIRADYGEESPQYQSYVLGQIPDGAAEAVIRHQWVEAAQARGPVEDRRPAVVSCDVAREGEDLTTIGVCERGKFDLARFSDGRRGWIAKSDLMTVANRVLEVAVDHAAAKVVVDDSGLGGGVTDRLRQLQLEGKLPKSIQVVACKFAESARRDDRFHGLKDELWWTTREALRNGLLSLPTDEEIRSWQLPRASDFRRQLTAPIYEYDSLDRIDVLDKRKPGREKTAGLPSKSPDLAHALILGAPYYLQQEGAPAPPPVLTPEQQVWANVQRVVQRSIAPPPRDPYRRPR